MTQHQNVLTRETVEKADQVFSVESPREVSVRACIAQLRRQLPFSLLFELERPFKNLGLQPVLPRPQIVGISAVNRVAKQEDQLHPRQYARHALSHSG